MDQLLVVPQSSDEIITLKNEADFDRKTAAATKEKLSDMVDSGFQGAVNKFFDAKSNAKWMQSNANNAAANGQILENQSLRHKGPDQNRLVQPQPLGWVALIIHRNKLVQPQSSLSQHHTNEKLAPIDYSM